MTAEVARIHLLDYGLDPDLRLNRSVLRGRHIPFRPLTTYSWRWGVLQWLGYRLMPRPVVFLDAAEAQSLPWESLPERLQVELAPYAQQLTDLGGQHLHAFLAPYLTLQLPLSVVLMAQAGERLLHSTSNLNGQGTWQAGPGMVTTRRQQHIIHEYSTMHCAYLSKQAGDWTFEHTDLPRQTLAQLLETSLKREPTAKPLSIAEWQPVQRLRHVQYRQQLMAWQALSVSDTFRLAEIDAQPEPFFSLDTD